MSIVGPNGAGKTTLVNLLTGLLMPTKGEVRFKGDNIAGIGPVKLAERGMARAFQLVQIFPAADGAPRPSPPRWCRSRASSWRLFSRLSAMPRSTRARRGDRRASSVWSTGCDTVSRLLSQGEKKLLDVASAFALKPEVILLDEPTSGVSTAEKHGVMRTLIGGGKRGGRQGHHPGRARHGPGGVLLAAHHRAFGRHACWPTCRRTVLRRSGIIETVVGKRREALDAEASPTSPSTSRAATSCAACRWRWRRASWSAWWAATAPARRPPSAPSWAMRKPVAGSIMLEGKSIVGLRPFEIASSALASRRRRARCSAT